MLSVACQQPKELGYSNALWTVNLLARHIQKVSVEKGHPSLKRASKSLVHGILDKAGIKPRKISYYLERRDPLFEKKMAQVLAVYKEVEIINLQENFNNSSTSQPRKRATISYDEKPGIQAIKNIAAQLGPVTGRHTTIGRDYEYKRLDNIGHMGNLKPLIDFFSGIANDPRIGSTHIALYSALYQLWVKQDCINPIRIYSYTVMPVAKISGLGTYHKTIKQLNEYGYLIYQPSFNRRGSKVYLG